MHPSLVCPRMGRWKTPGVLNIFRFSKVIFSTSGCPLCVKILTLGTIYSTNFDRKILSPVSLGLPRWWPGQIPDPETLHKFHKGVLSELISHGQPSSWGKLLVGALM